MAIVIDVKSNGENRGFTVTATNDANGKSTSIIDYGDRDTQALAAAFTAKKESVDPKITAIKTKMAGLTAADLGLD